jgi:hypothetical protein
MEWDSDDREKAIAYNMEKNSRCQMCGTAPWEWDEDKRAYEPVEDICWGCYYKDIAQEESGKGLPGTSINLKPTGGVEHAQRLVASQQAMEEPDGD